MTQETGLPGEMRLLGQLICSPTDSESYRIGFHYAADVNGGAGPVLTCVGKVLRSDGTVLVTFKDITPSGYCLQDSDL